MDRGRDSPGAFIFDGLAYVIHQADFPVFRVGKDLLRQAVLRRRDISRSNSSDALG